MGYNPGISIISMGNIEYGGFQKWGYPKWMVYFMENLEMDDDWGYLSITGCSPIAGPGWFFYRKIMIVIQTIIPSAPNTL